MAEENTGSCVSDGFTLRHVAQGTGPTALVIGSSIYYPRTFSQSLRSHLRMVFLDHKGFGVAPASFGLECFALPELVKDVERIRREAGGGRVIVVGHSGHGYMALEYAKAYPELVSHVVLIAMSPDASPASFQAADRYLEESVCPERKAALERSMRKLPGDLEADPKRRFIHYGLRSGPRIWHDHAYDAGPLWEGVTVVPEMFDHVWGRLFGSIDIAEGLDRLEAPVFLALGRHDYWNPPHLWEPLRKAFRSLRIRVFEQSGHTPQLEEAEAFDAELLAWLRETGRADG